MALLQSPLFTAPTGVAQLGDWSCHANVSDYCLLVLLLSTCAATLAARLSNSCVFASGLGTSIEVECMS